MASNPYEIASLFGSGAQGFIKGMQDAENSKMKKMELEALQKARDDEFERNKLVDAINMRKAGLMQNEAGELADTPEGLAEKDLERRTKEANLAKIYSEISGKTKEGSAQGKIEKLTGDQRKRFDDVTGALNALAGVESAYSNIQEKADKGGFLGKIKGMYEMADDPSVGLPFTDLKIPIRAGDTDYTTQARNFSELFGRLQSGGAIGKEEEKRFREMLPTATDSKEVAKSKIAFLKNELESRMSSFGVTKEQAEGMGRLKAPVLAGGKLKSGILDTVGLMNAAAGSGQAAYAGEVPKKKVFKTKEIEWKD